MKQLTKYYAGRDMIGIRPLYTVVSNGNIDMFSSEIKGMSSYDGEIVEFEPGTIVMTEKNLSYYSSQKFYMTKVLYEDKKYLISN
jgi:asparagine synthetase B (glutamine-hydrolysing)